MINLGARWRAEHRRIIHTCAPALWSVLSDGQAECACGARVPRLVLHFQSWLSSHPDITEPSPAVLSEMLVEDRRLRDDTAPDQAPRQDDEDREGPVPAESGPAAVPAEISASGVTDDSLK